MRTNYTFGRALEYQIQAELTDYGYFTMRSSASKGPVDVIAARAGEWLLIQAKRTGRLDPAEWNALYRLAVENGAKALLARKQPKSNRGNLYWRLVGEKIPHQRNPPLEIWHPVALGQGTLWE